MPGILQISLGTSSRTGWETSGGRGISFDLVGMGLEGALTPHLITLIM
jgi:hypothetical protein